MEDIKELIISSMKEKNSPMEIEEISMQIGNVATNDYIYETLKENDEFFCLTKKVWFLKNQINLIIEEAIKNFIVTGQTNKYGYVYFKDIYDYTRKVLDKNNISMDRLCDLMAENPSIQSGKNTRWWKIISNGFGTKSKVNNENINSSKLIDENINSLNITYEKIKTMIDEYFSNVRIPLTEEEILEDLTCIIDIDSEDYDDAKEKIRGYIKEIITESALYMKADVKRWVPRSFLMYDEYLADFNAQLNRIIDDLPEKHKYIFEARNGIGMEKITYQAIGDSLLISKQRVTQIYEKVLARVKKHSRVFRVYGSLLQEMIKRNNNIIKRDELINLMKERQEFNSISPDSVLWMFENKVFTWSAKYNNLYNIFYINNYKVKLLFNLVKGEFENNLLEKRTSIIDIDKLDYPENKLEKKTIAYYLSCFPHYYTLKEGVYYLKNTSKLTRFDYIFIVLFKNGNPMHFDKITELINNEFGKDYEPRDIQSALINHTDVFLRKEIATYGLRQYN